MIDGYKSVEAFYVAMKTKDKGIRAQIREMNGFEAKKFGRTLVIREDWEEIKLQVMQYALNKKFAPGSELAKMLLATGHINLVETNYWHDNFWGDCYCQKCADIKGQNHLGEMLMRIRENLRNNGDGNVPSVPNNPQTPQGGENMSGQLDKSNTNTQPTTQGGSEMKQTNKAVRGKMSVTTLLSGRWRILTNNLRTYEQDALEKFKEEKEPQWVTIKTPQGRTIKNYLVEIHSGDWVYPALERLNNRGIKFRLGSISIKDLNKEVEKGRLNVENLVNQSTFCWANASYAFFLYIDEMDKKYFTLEAMDMVALDAKKTSKRLQEVTRQCQMRKSGKLTELSWLMLDDSDMENMEGQYDRIGNWPANHEGVTLELDSSDRENLYDGMVVVSQTFMRKMCYKMDDGHEKRRLIAMIMGGRIDRFIFRLLTPYGLVKGLGLCRPDDVMSHDVIFHRTALKPELFADGDTYHATAFIHESVHTAMWDMQSTFNNHDWLLTEERFVQDSETLLQDVRTSMDNNEVPDFILNQIKHAHDESGAQNIEQVTGGWKTNVVKWLQEGMELSASANFNNMALGSVERQMRAARDNRRWWLPMSNAFTATVNTYEALKHLAKMDLPESKKDLVFYIENIGVVIPGHRFVKTRFLHDTWDQDGDQAKFIWIKIWCSENGLEKLQTLKEDHVIPNDMIVPATPEEAIDVCVVIRSPNGPGGYSIQYFDAETMPWHRRNDDRVPVVNMETAPFGLQRLLETSEVGEIPRSVVYTNTLFSRENARRMISAQLLNPNVGMYANLIMGYSAIMGISYPEWLPANNNDVIDMNQQEADAVAFDYLADGMKTMQENILKQFYQEQIPIDRFVFDTRMSAGLSDLVTELFEPLLFDGKFTRMDRVNERTLELVKSAIVEASFGRRMECDTRQLVMDKLPTIKQEHAVWAREIFREFNTRLKRIDIQYNNHVDFARGASINGRYFKMFAEADRTKNVSKVVEDLYNKINSYTAPEKWTVLLYRWIIDPSLSSTKYGASDRIIFQNGTKGQPTIMDFLIQGIKNL
jgi:ribA/ribD-fused uncharacterized protein